jgi:hypothetical protein
MVNGSLLDPDQTTSRALPHAKDDLRPVFLNRVDKLFAMKANWKDKLSEIFRSRKVLDDPTGDIVGKPFVRTEPVDENAHGNRISKEQGDLCYGEERNPETALTFVILNEVKNLDH